MKQISLSELRRNTGKWVRSVHRHGTILICDRNTPIAKLLPIDKRPRVNRFARWKPLKRFAEALSRPVLGTPVEQIIAEDRERL